MIVLTEQQKDKVKKKYGYFKELNPIEIKGGLYILPERILDDNDFPVKVLKKFEIREVEESEFIEYEI